jgi:Domain of unknown function (DUF4258)
MPEREAEPVGYRFSKHVLEQLDKRAIPRVLVEQVLSAPQQMVPELDDITCFQSRVKIGGKPYLLRVMVNQNVQPSVVVTAYLSSKVSKYWR